MINPNANDGIQTSFKPELKLTSESKPKLQTKTGLLKPFEDDTGSEYSAVNVALNQECHLALSAAHDYLTLFDLKSGLIKG